MIPIAIPKKIHTREPIPYVLANLNKTVINTPVTMISDKITMLTLW
ncbi:hypothetical protein BBR47_40000 [Brevibacillus brevis NBRC 100599]|uniref:Uncharacterized protein n=1 Tax=Brevibacillus brevis (strain 47 / JCM 6285 / NBRC 100599) TaxID=358681 RepID=C0ZGR8_BREBN|nr:hypothetical protein BBR47_40000 [Brevibacillus brevis NBRC 100599]